MKLLFTLLLASLFSLPALGQADRATLHDIRVDVVYLASDFLKGREAGTNDAFLAAEYISQRFQDLGLKPAGTNGTWYQLFDFMYTTSVHPAQGEGEPRTCRNVAGFLDNGAPTTVVIGAHYDHIGMGDHGSRAPNTKAIHNGADDNASGVAGLIYLADQLHQSKAKNNNYLFVAFSAEELGLYGSKHFVNHLPISQDQINYMLNMDMIGRMDADKALTLAGTGTSPNWEAGIASLNDLDYKVTKSPDGIGPSDHTSFYLKDIPVLHFFTGAHDDYHTPSDDTEFINFEGIYGVGEYMVALIEALDGKGKLEFSKAQTTSNSKRAAAYKVTLGVMPDYTQDEEGMKIDAVIEGRPAHAAGLEDGDVVIQIDEYKIKDIYEYMDALSKFEKGDQVEVTVMRDKKKVRKQVTF